MSDGKVTDEEWQKMKENARKVTNEQKSVKFNVTVDNKPLIDAEARAQEAEQRAEDAEEKLDMITEKQAEKILDRFEIDPEKRAEFDGDPEGLEAYIAGLKDGEKSAQKGKGTGGSALTPEQLAGREIKNGQEFGSVEDMVDTLRDRASNGDKLAEAQLEEMLRKWARGMKEQPHQSTYEDKEFRTLENLRTQKRRRRLQSGNYREER